MSFGFANKHEILIRAIYDKELADKISNYANNRTTYETDKKDEKKVLEE